MSYLSNWREVRNAVEKYARQRMKHDWPSNMAMSFDMLEPSPHFQTFVPGTFLHKSDRGIVLIHEMSQKINDERKANTDSSGFLLKSFDHVIATRPDVLAAFTYLHDQDEVVALKFDSFKNKPQIMKKHVFLLEMAVETGVLIHKPTHQPFTTGLGVVTLPPSINGQPYWYTVKGQGGGGCGSGNISQDLLADKIYQSKYALPPVCDCGGHKCGYKDDEPHGHAHWCRTKENK